MAVKPDGAPSEAAAHRRWLITIAITILFGTFGAVMTYLSYAKSSRPWSPSKAPSSVPDSVPSVAPAAPTTEEPAAEEPSSSQGDKDKHDKNK